VEDAVLRRVEGLSAEARTVLQTAAVTGRRFDFDLLARVTGLNEGHLLPLVRELVGAQLVVEQSADRFAFRHALTREAVYQDLLARERRALHRAVAEAMEHDGAADAGELADLSYHCYEGGLWDRVLIHARAAGEQAAALFAPAATIEHLTRVIDACRQLGATAPAAVLRLRGQAYELTGEFELARADHEAALALARAANDRQAEWRALLDLGMLWSGQDYAEAGRAYRGALRVSRGLHDERAYADTLNQLGNWSSNTGSPLLGLPRHERALAIFQSLGDAAGVARTLDLAAMASLLGCDHVRAAEYYEQAIAAFAALDDRRGLASSLACLAPLCGAYHTDTAVAAVDYERAVTAGERALRLSRETGWRAGESFALWNVANAIGPRGEYDRALELAHQSLAIAEEIEHRQWIVAALCAITAIYEDLLAPETARPYAERALQLARETKSWLWIGQATARQASLLATRGDTNAAYELLAPLLIARTRGEVSGLRLVRCEAAELALRASEPERALSLVDALIDSLPGPARPVPRLLWLRGRALTALGRRDEAADALRLASTQAEADRLPALQWRIDVSLGELARTDGRTGDAATAFTRVRALTSELAPRIPEGTLRNGFRDAVGWLLPSGDSEGQRVTVRAAAPGGLTPREREVASLLASGLSNREVAEQLVLSERTVESHVSSALAKLQLRSRTQLATWAIQAGLAQP
jgi:DNA-binding NarL/FixJ family response regulator